MSPLLRQGWLSEPSDFSLRKGIDGRPGRRVPTWQSESKAKTEMERAEIFAILRIRINSIIETNRSDGQLIAQADAERVTHVVEAGFLRSRQKITGIGK